MYPLHTCVKWKHSLFLFICGNLCRRSIPQSRFALRAGTMNRRFHRTKLRNPLMPTHVALRYLFIDPGHPYTPSIRIV